MSKEKLMAEVEIGNNGEVFVDTDTIIRTDGVDVGYDDDDDGDFEGEYDDDGDFEGEYDDDDGDFEGEDTEVGRRRRRRGGSGRSQGRSSGRRGGRRSGRRSGGKKKTSTDNWTNTAIGGETTITEAGLVIVKITPQHDFKSDAISFLGTTAGTSILTTKFADVTVLDVDGGLDVTHYNETGKNKENFQGHFLKSGLTATLTFKTSADSGVVKVALFGKKPKV